MEIEKSSSTSGPKMIKLNKNVNSMVATPKIEVSKICKEPVQIIESKVD